MDKSFVSTDETAAKDLAAPPFKGVCLLVTDIDAASGGIQKQSRRLLAELDGRGAATLVCARNYSGLARDERNHNTIYHRTPTFGRALRVFNSLVYLLDGLIWLIRRRNDYDVIHCQQLYGSAMLGLFAKSVLQKPVTVRITSSGELGEVGQIQKMRFAKLRLRQFRGIDKWIVLTTQQKQEVETLGVAAKDIKIIFNSTVLPAEVSFNRTAKARQRALLNLGDEQIAVFVGRLSSEKGLDTLVAAWAKVREKFPRSRLLLCGEGGMYRNVETEIRSLIGELGLAEAINFLGHVANATDYLLAANVFVLPTRIEGMSNSLVEAMAAGAAIVTTNIPANLDICRNQVNSLLVEPDDAENLANSLCQIFADSELEARLGKSARETAEQHLSIDSMVEKYLDVYQNLIRRDV